MASLRKWKDPNNKTWWFVDYRAGGKRHREHFKRKREAQERKKVVELDLAQERINFTLTGTRAREISPKEAIALYLKHCREKERPNAESWVEYKEHVLNDFFKMVNAKTLRQVSPEMLQEWQSSRKKRVSTQTARRGVIMMTTFLRWARKGRYVSEIATELMMDRIPASAPPRPTYLTKAEARALLMVCAAPVPVNQRKGNHTKARKLPLFEIASVAIYTGMRVSEILHLRWQDIDLDRGVVRVRCDEEFKPKDREERPIPIHRDLHPVLLAWHKKSRRFTGLIFRTGTGTLYRKRNVARELQKAAKRAEVEGGCNFQKMRRTFTSLGRQDGIPKEYAQAYLGHVRRDVIDKHYTDLAPERTHHIINRFSLEDEKAAEATGTE